MFKGAFKEEMIYRNPARLATLFSLFIVASASMCIQVAFATPVYIDGFTGFPAYPYNTVGYIQGGAYLGCGPTTGAMIFGYFQHHFDLTTLLVQPAPVGTDEGLNTAWTLHDAAYMNTQPDGFGDYHYIKSGLEDLAEDRGHQIKVMARVSPSVDPADPYYLANYGAYGDGWTNDGDFWVNLGGGVWDIDPNKFCDFIGPKLSSGTVIFLTVDSNGDGGGDHWIPCVGYDKAAGLYYYYNTYDTTLHSADINGVGAPGPAMYAISFVRTVEYIGSIAQPPLTVENIKTWYWTSLTYLHSVAKGDVDADGNVEIVTGGYYNDFTRYNAQLCIWDGSTLLLENVQTWYWTSDTLINSVAVGDVDGDSETEVVTGGNYWDDACYVAQLCVWDGSTLALENVKTWYWTGDTYINSVAVGDVDGDSATEVVTGGSYWDGNGYNAQLCVWDGATLTLKNVKTWYWASWTFINSVAVGDVDGDSATEVVTGGCYWDGSRYNDQLCVWGASTLALEQVTTWYWTADTKMYSVAVTDVNGDAQAEIVTGGNYWDGTRVVAQLCVWDGSTLALENVKTWYWTGDTDINTVAVGDVDGDTEAEVVTGGLFNDGICINAQLCIWDGGTLLLENVQTWYWIGDSVINSVATGDVDGDAKTEVVTGGQYDDGIQFVAQLCVWTQ